MGSFTFFSMGVLQFANCRYLSVIAREYAFSGEANWIFTSWCYLLTTIKPLLTHYQRLDWWGQFGIISQLTLDWHDPMHPAKGVKNMSDFLVLGKKEVNIMEFSWVTIAVLITWCVDLLKCEVEIYGICTSSRFHVLHQACSQEVDPLNSFISSMACHGKWTIEIGDFPVKTSMYMGFSIAMFDYRWFSLVYRWWIPSGFHRLPCLMLARRLSSISIFWDNQWWWQVIQ